MVYISVHGISIGENRIPNQKYRELNKNFYFDYVRMNVVFNVKSKADIPPQAYYFFPFTVPKLKRAFTCCRKSFWSNRCVKY